MPTTDQPSLLARIRKLSARIVSLQRKFDLPKGHKDRFETYGGAQSLQTARTERQAAQGQLDPIRLVASGISCRDCLHFADVDEPACWRGLQTFPTKIKRSEKGTCGPEARLFEPVAAHA